MNIYIGITMLLTSSIAFADVCKSTYVPQEIFKKALEKEFSFEMKEKEIAAMDGYIADAFKIYNPDFEHFTTAGDQFGKQNITSESRIWFNLQLAGKRQKRADVVKADQEIGRAELQALKLKLRKELLLGMLRYKQIQNETKFIDSLQDSMEALLDRYTKVSFLSAEQKVEKGSLDMSQNDLTLREAELRNESELILRFFQRALRDECEILVNLDSPLKENSWPQMKEVKFKTDESLAVKLSELAMKKSEFEIIREDSKKYPDLKIGPVWQLNRLGSQEYNIFGVGLILPLPIFDRNQGLISVAQIQHERAQLTIDRTRQVVSEEFSFRRKNYIRLKNKYHDVNELEKYQKLLVEYRQLFKRGLITIPNFLNFKREFLNFTSEVYKIETAMADHLIEIYFINNEGTDQFVPKVLKL